MTDDAERTGGDVGPRCRTCGVRLFRFVAYQHPPVWDAPTRCAHYDLLCTYVDDDDIAAGGGGGGAEARGGGAAGDARAERLGGASAGGDATAGAGVRGASVLHDHDGWPCRSAYCLDDGEEVMQ